MAEAVEDAFRYGKLVLATITYNGDIFPFMRTYIENLNRTQLPEPHHRTHRKRKLGSGSGKSNAGNVRKEQKHYMAREQCKDHVLTQRSK